MSSTLFAGPFAGRALLLSAAVLFALPASAQIRLRPAPGALAVTGGTAGEAMRVTTQAAASGQRQRLSERYRGITVNRSRRASARTGSARGFASGDIVMPALRTPQASYVRRGGSAFRAVRRTH